MTTPNRTPRQPPGRALRPLTVQIDADTYDRLKAEAAKVRRPMSALARYALEAYVATPDLDADR